MARCWHRNRFLAIAFPLLVVSVATLAAFALPATAQRRGARRTAPPAAPPAATALQLNLASEQPSNVFHDRDTLQTQTALIFSLRLGNIARATRPVKITWRIEDAEGRQVWKQTSVGPVAAGAQILRRELFEAPRLGAYCLTVEAFARGNRGQDRAFAALPFAVVPAPAASYRPHSFFALSTPTHLAPGQLDFFARSGARVLRSPWLPVSNGTLPGLVSDGADRSFTALDRQMQARLERNIATWAVLPAGGDTGEAPSFGAQLVQNGPDESANLRRTLLSSLPRYSAVKRWEIFGGTTGGQWESWLREARRLRLDVAMLGPLDARQNAAAHAPWDGTLVSLPLSDVVREPTSDTTGSASTLRTLLWARRRAVSAANSKFYVAQNESFSARDARAAAGELVSRYIVAVVAGASGMSAPGLLPTVAATPSEAAEGTRRMARGAAFATMSKLLENAAWRGELFSSSPVLWGASFRAGRENIAVLWNEAEGRQEDARLHVRLPGARVLDVFGNEVARSRRSNLVVPLGAGPVYVLSNAPAATFAAAWPQARVQDMPALAIQVLPLTQKPHPRSQSIPAPLPQTSGWAVTPARRPISLRVRVQNVLHQPVSGLLRIRPPRRWRIAGDAQKFRLSPGQSRIYRFVVNESVAEEPAAYEVFVSADTNQGDWRWKARVPVATADNLKRGQSLRVDGDLSDWRGANWMEIGTVTPQRRERTAAPGVAARVALRWDERQLFVAAQVREPNFRTRRSAEAAYPFWDGYDALQLAFGLRNDPTSVPSRGPFRDTDYGFLLSPFEERPRGEGGAFAGRVLRLWNANIPFSGASDPVRWGGTIPGSRCSIRRVSSQGVTNYEASFPLNEMPTMRPAERAAGDVPVRFSWMLHNDEGPALQWSRVAGVFPWWSNTGSFLPQQIPVLPAQTALGFTREGAIAALPLPGNLSALPAAVVERQPERQIAPQPRLVAPPAQRRVNRRPRQRTRRVLPAPQLEPMSPRILPPASVPPGQILPPAPVRSEPLPRLPAPPG